MKISIGLCLGAGLLALTTAGCGQDPSFLERESKGRSTTDAKVAGAGGSVEDGGIVYDENGNPVDPASAGSAGNGGDGSTVGGDSTVGDVEGDDESASGQGGGNDWLPDWAQTDDQNGSVNPEALPEGGGSGNGDGGSGGGGNGGGGDGGNGDGTGSGGDQGTTNNGTGGNPPMPDVPAADDEDLDALHKCLAKWRNHPFKGTVTNYQRIYASVSVFGSGNVINDTESTDDPFLILVDAGVNVYGAPTYNLLNKNGYYCIKVNVNVLTALTVNLHCNARLADSKVNVNVGSTQNDTTSAVGVNVMSAINVNTVRPQGDKCIR